ncbi:hypothetical protein C0995_015673 [Termitomyces sp. Mi166|nr:hypothetical protein C0995_015673 [Termitomyces sp. Mi166\
MDSDSKDLQPMAFYTQSIIAIELNYDIYDKELLAIVEVFKQCASPDAYFKANNFQTATDNLVAALHNSTPSLTTFTLSSDGKLLL